jgi:hypothetical protein
MAAGSVLRRSWMPRAAVWGGAAAGFGVVAGLAVWAGRVWASGWRLAPLTAQA